MAKNRYGGQIGLSGESEKILLQEAKRYMVFLRPFLLWPLIIVFMVLIRAIWPASIPVIVFLLFAGVVLAGCLWYFSHERKKAAGKWHGVISVLLLSGVLAYADYAGFTHATLFIALIGIPAFMLTWAIRNTVRSKDDFSANFAEIFDKAGVAGSKIRFNVPDKIAGKITSITGKIHLPRAEKTPDDLQKRGRLIEGGIVLPNGKGLPPGSLTVVANEDDAAVADFTLSDPRVLRDPIPWTAPSAPGKSIAVPIHVGTWQDGAPVNWSITEQHVQVMGMTGSGKSLGAGWSTLSELITRKDVAIFAADITKGHQTLGPFASSVNRLETTKEGARKMLLDVGASVKARTDFLASIGLAKWQEDCGLAYLVVWLEEAPDIIDSLGEAGEGKWISSLKAARSAGITFVISLQRSDWTQLPTIARGQLSKWCFGVAESTDASFGLSELQLERNASPELWGMRHPGKAYLDAPGIPEERVAMPMRTWYFGKTDAKIREHTDRYPATFRMPLDSVTTSAMAHYGAGASDPMGTADSGAESLTEAEDEPGFDYTQGDRPLEPASEELVAWKFRPDTTPSLNGDSGQDAKEVLRTFIMNSKLATITIADIGDIAKSQGKKRQWLYWAMDKMTDLVERDDDASIVTWHVLGRDETEYNIEKARTFIAGSKARAEEYGAPVDENMKPADLLPLFTAPECYLCGTALGAKRQIDHRVPLSKGGRHAADNLGATCDFCNQSKGDDTEAEYRARMDAV